MINVIFPIDIVTCLILYALIGQPIFDTITDWIDSFVEFFWEIMNLIILIRETEADIVQLQLTLARD
jgi:hypothetical protein